MSDIIQLHSDFGGELGEMIEMLREHDGTCICGEKFPLTMPEGYIHGGGLDDKHGDNYWLFYSCPDCGHQMKWSTILHRLRIDGVVPWPE